MRKKQQERNIQSCPEVAITTDDETAVETKRQTVRQLSTHERPAEPAEVPSGFLLPLHVGFHQSSDEDDHPRCESGDVGWDGMGCVKGSEI